MASEITQAILDLDVRRDNALVGISSVVNGNLFLFDDFILFLSNKRGNNNNLYLSLCGFYLLLKFCLVI